MISSLIQALEVNQILQGLGVPPAERDQVLHMAAKLAAVGATDKSETVQALCKILATGIITADNLAALSLQGIKIPGATKMKITNTHQLDALPEGTILLFPDGEVGRIVNPHTASPGKHIRRTDATWLYIPLENPRMYPIEVISSVSEEGTNE